MDDLTVGGVSQRSPGVQDIARIQEGRPAVAPPEPADSGSSENSQSNAQGGNSGETLRARSERVLSNAFSGKNVHLRIEVDKENGGFVYLGIDSETGEVVKRFPPEEVVQRIKSYRGGVEGVAVDRKL